MEKENINYQLVPPHIYRPKLIERAIHSFKNHFKAGLATLDPDFPLVEWYMFIPQATITLNLLRSSSINPKLSAYTYIFGQFDYNKIKVLAHSKPDNILSWIPNGEET